MTSSTDLKARAEILVPDHARDNYDQMARDIAKQEGISPKAAMGRIVDGWKQQHELRPLDGFDVLAAWGEDRDPGDGADSLAGAAALARAVESAKREPQQYLAGHDDVQAAAATALEGHVPNSGPVGDPEDTGKNAGPANLAGSVVDHSAPATESQSSTAADDDEPRKARRQR